MSTDTIERTIRTRARKEAEQGINARVDAFFVQLFHDLETAPMNPDSYTGLKGAQKKVIEILLQLAEDVAMQDVANRLYPGAPKGEQAQ